MVTKVRPDCDHPQAAPFGCLLDALGLARGAQGLLWGALGLSWDALGILWGALELPLAWLGLDRRGSLEKL